MTESNNDKILSQLIAKTAECERLREGLSKVEDAFLIGPELHDELKDLVKHETPPGIGDKVLELARAALNTVEAMKTPVSEHDAWGDGRAYAIEKTYKALYEQEELLSPETRKMLVKE